MVAQLKRNKIADIALLAVFCSLTLLVNFFHTEKATDGGQACPACQFLSSSIATQVTQCLFVPQLEFVDVIEAFLVFRFEQLVSVDRSPRGPPQA
ncbi:MAG: hypothetical protein A2W20_08480 [Candidatus Aminicenantes bacterium RBG_16_66_30]|nr:MAG: hypothetical protein A2W20_08480 [Candidatus Aminicenantes bacterium RBG_16_66_30]